MDTNQNDITDVAFEEIKATPKVQIADVQLADIPDADFEEIKAVDAAPHSPVIDIPLARPKLKETMEVVIKYGSALTPGNVVLLGTGDLNGKYRTWLEKRFQDGLTCNDPSKKMTKERINLYFTVQSLCTMAVSEDEAEVVTYRWDGPAFTRKHKTLNIPAVVQEFVKAKFDILYAIAPFFGVKINRVSSSNQSSDVQEPLPEKEATEVVVPEETKEDIII